MQTLHRTPFVVRNGHKNAQNAVSHGGSSKVACALQEMNSVIRGKPEWYPLLSKRIRAATNGHTGNGQHHDNILQQVCCVPATPPLAHELDPSHVTPKFLIHIYSEPRTRASKRYLPHAWNLALARRRRKLHSRAWCFPRPTACNQMPSVKRLETSRNLQKTISAHKSEGPRSM